MASGGVSAVVGAPLIRSFSSLPGLKYGTFLGGTSTLSPVFGLRPLRGSRLRSRKLPKPRNSIFSPRWSAVMMLRNTVSTITSECFLVRSETRETSSTSSAFVMLPPSAADASCSSTGSSSGVPLLILRLEVIAQGRLAATRLARVLLPVGPEFIGLERTDAQADFPFRRHQ